MQRVQTSPDNWGFRGEAEPELAIAVGAIETVGAEPLVVADDGFAARIVAVRRDIDRGAVGGDDDRRSGAAEADADEDLRLRLGWGREEKRASGYGGHDGFGNESFYVCEFHNGPPDYTRMNTGGGERVVRNICAAAV